MIKWNSGVVKYRFQPPGADGERQTIEQHQLRGDDLEVPHRDLSQGSDDDGNQAIGYPPYQGRGHESTVDEQQFDDENDRMNYKFASASSGKDMRASQNVG